MKYDAHQLDVTTDDDQAIKFINVFVENLMLFDKETDKIFEHANAKPECALLQCYAALMYVFCQSKNEALLANQYIDRALTHYDDLTPREQLFIQAAQAGIENRFEDALKFYEDIGKQWPNDLVAAKMLSFHCFETGEDSRQLNYFKKHGRANAEQPHFLAMLAFAYELNGEVDQCIHIANKSIELLAHNPWGYHALAHAYTNNGQYHNGIRVLRETESIWSKGNQYIQSHMGFHLAALYLTELDYDNAIDIYHQYVWDKQPDTIVEQTDAILLLWYIELAGRNLSYEWQRLTPHIEPHTNEFSFPFLNIIFIYALQRAGETDKATKALQALKQFSDQQQGEEATRWQQYGLPLAEACMAFGEKNYDQSSKLLANTFTFTEAGGSDEQRGVFWQSYLQSLIHSGQDKKAVELLNDMMGQSKMPCALEDWWQQQIKVHHPDASAETE
ncbi:MAG: hypothetical protein P1U34_02160 [Coxiellaceae bacterium]|nr:hypothetical protein [Coxiellaceae bacterium]